MELSQHVHAGEHIDSVAAAAKCLHAECSCSVLSGEAYCSDYCARSAEAQVEQANSDDHKCSCGHPECTHAAATTPLAPLIAPILT